MYSEKKALRGIGAGWRGLLEGGPRLGGGGEDGDLGAAALLLGRAQERRRGRRKVAELVLAGLLGHRKGAPRLTGRVHVVVLHVGRRAQRVQTHPAWVPINTISIIVINNNNKKKTGKRAYQSHLEVGTEKICHVATKWSPLSCTTRDGVAITISRSALLTGKEKRDQSPPPSKMCHDTSTMGRARVPSTVIKLLRATSLYEDVVGK